MICDESNRPCLCFNVIIIIIIYFVDFQMLFLLFYVFPHLFCLLVIQFSACYPSIMERKTTLPRRPHTHPSAPTPRKRRPRRREAETRWEFTTMMAHPLPAPPSLGSHHRRPQKVPPVRAPCHHSVSKAYSVHGVVGVCDIFFVLVLRVPMLR